MVFFRRGVTYLKSRGLSRKKTFLPCDRVNEVVMYAVSWYKACCTSTNSAEFVTMKISVSDVEYVARLARLELSEEEKCLFAGQMGAILGYVEKLKELNTDGILPTSHAVPMENAFREDVACPSIGIEKALANAPDRAESFYRVPKVIE
jgi:aspartyl-tRNA(Asn)/glutamyl-tRNA(Gln) amidotransferase subunit C